MTGGDWSLRMAQMMIADRQQLLRWHYETGCALKALEAVWALTGDDKFFAFIRTIGDSLVAPDGSIRGYNIEEYNLDQINTGKALIFLHHRTMETKYRLAVELLRSQMRKQPRTASGGYWHKKIYPHQMWLDGLYMAGPFLAEYGRVYGEPELFDEVARQLLLVEQKTRDPRTGLLYHAWDERRAQRWADPETGTSPHFWSRAMGWYAMALVDVLDHLPADHARRCAIVETFGRMVEALAGVQDPKTGLWYQVMDRGGEGGNYLEASGTCMFIYAILKGVRLNNLNRRYLSIAHRAYQGVLDYLLSEDRQGRPVLNNICGCAGLGGEPYRDGSYEYYVSEKIIPNDPKGVAPFILASVERERGEGEGV